MSLLLPLRFSQQPQGAVSINHANPITRGIATVFLPRYQQPIVDLVTGAKNTNTVPPGYSVGQGGVAYVDSGNWSVSMAPTGIPGGYPGITTFSLFEFYALPGGGNMFGGGPANTVYNRFEKIVGTGQLRYIYSTNSGGQITAPSALNLGQVYAATGTQRFGTNYREFYIGKELIAVDTSAQNNINSSYSFAGSITNGNRGGIKVYCTYVWTRELSKAEIFSITDNPWQIFAPQQRRIFVSSPVTNKVEVSWLEISPGAGAATLNADSGSYSITGQDAALSALLNLSADAGSYAVTGQDAALNFIAQRDLSADAGTYNINGQAAEFIRAIIWSADSGVYTLDGQAATLSLFKRLSADAGVYNITGQDASTLKSSLDIAETGSYFISGRAADLVVAKFVSADAGGYDISGQAAELLYPRSIDATSGAYVIDGQPATLTTVTLFPNPADVRAGVVYGPGGIYTGTLVVRGAVIYLFDD